MLKIRLVAVVVLKGAIAVQSIGFRRYLPIGDPRIAIEYLNRWGIDEVILLDIEATKEQRAPKFEILEACSRVCQAPLAIGGGITSIEDIRKAIYFGADKVVINTAAFKMPGLISEGAKQFGRQCIVVSVDARKVSSERYEVYTCSGENPTGLSPVDFARQMENLGAGEILINSIDRDGSGVGYDIELVRQVQNAVDLPVIACGGVGHPEHLAEAASLGISAMAAANFFHHYEQSVVVAKQFLKSRLIPIRLDSSLTYAGCSFDSLGRVDKKDDAFLERLFVEHVVEEVI